MRPPNLLALGLSVLTTLSAAQTPSKDAMQGLRKAALSRTAASWKFRRDRAFPSVFGVVVDFPIGDQIGTIVCLRDGSTGLYTTGTFGIVGGGMHPSIRKASIALVKLAGSFWSEGKPSKSTSYPAKGRVRFSLLGYDGNRVVETTLQSINGKHDRLSPVWIAANRVLTELRVVSDTLEHR